MSQELFRRLGGISKESKKKSEILEDTEQKLVQNINRSKSVISDLYYTSLIFIARRGQAFPENEVNFQDVYI